MKNRRLSEIDLARIATLPSEKRAKELRYVRNGKVTLTYAPFRSHSHDVFNVQPDMFGPVEQTDWSIVERFISKKARTDKEKAANLGVAKALHDYAKAFSIRARSQKFGRLILTSGGKVSFWLDMILAIDKTPVIPFIDPRRSHGLNFEARRFVFSMMHEHIRAAEPDLADVALCIIQFAKGDDDERTPMFHYDTGVELFDHWTLNGMISETYDIWLQVLAEGKAEARRKTGTGGSLL